MGREISKNTVSMGKENFAEGLVWGSASKDGENKKIIEIFRRQMSKLNVERSLGESQVSEIVGVGAVTNRNTGDTLSGETGGLSSWGGGCGERVWKDS